MSRRPSDLPRLLTAAEMAAPVEAVAVIAEDLRRRFAATKVSFLIVDLTGRALARLSTATTTGTGTGTGTGGETERIPLSGSVYEQVIRTQRPHHEPAGREQRVIVPVTNRGDAIGLLELLLPADRSEEDVVHAVGEAAHALAYVVIANGRFTDFYTWGKRTRPPTLAAEIQYQLLPQALSCEAAQFTFSGSLEPSEDLSGDTFDYSLDRDTLHLSVTDPMGHDLDAALTATVLVGALRRARRAGATLAEQARQGDQALTTHGHGHATGQLLRINLHTGKAKLVNAGHPWPLRMRAGVVETITCQIDQPFGLALAPPRPYRIQTLDLRPGDRLLMLTDGMLERHGEKIDMADLLRQTRSLHPRETTLMLTSAVRDASGGRLEDDATVTCLDWHGPQEEHRHVSSGADTQQASTARTPNH
ncbi:PP2C family protein-serine/threonine phosphatase [Streptomyces sp. TRM75563]|uniref:PP2C family protein-serine/threonine phosphatase n=1 Tax=Streptomyces sp. TRM75563 TaxID=2817418 RepID=UPI001F607FC6|nr:PP2C family protein-serine/threonine phosphatase [Streptomyces sp. TRM75563]MCI4041398.1 serine/threonine-protein phosphatase [Streptomyces sp. TRM75563]